MPPPPAARTVDPRPLLRGTQCSLAQKPCLPQTAPGQGLSALGSRCWQAWHSCEGVLGPRPAVRDAFTSPSLRKDFDGGQRPFPASPASSLPPHTGVSPNKVLTAHFIFLSFGSSEDPGSHIWDFCLLCFVFLSATSRETNGKILAGFSLGEGRKVPGFPSWPCTASPGILS